MKRILIVQRNLTYYRKLLFKYIEEQGDFSLDILTMGKKTSKHNNIHVFPFLNLGQYKNYQLNLSKGMIDFIKAHYQEYDYIILEGATNIINNMSICRFLINKNKPYIVWDSGRRKDSKMSFPRKMVQGMLEFMWKNATCIIAYSTLAKKYFVEIGIPDPRVFVCQNTLYVKAFDQEIAATSPDEIGKIKKRFAPDGEKIVLYVGAVEKRKRIQDLIDAFDLVKKKNLKASLVIIGNGDQMEVLRDYTKDTKDIFFLGSITDGVIAYFMAADVFVLPSEGGLSINQAMICKKPVIASSADGTELDLIDVEENGFLFTETNVEELSEAIYKISSDDNLRISMGKHSREIIDTKVNEKAFYKNFSDCLKNVE